MTEGLTFEILPSNIIKYLSKINIFLKRKPDLHNKYQFKMLASSLQFYSYYEKLSS